MITRRDLIKIVGLAGVGSALPAVAQPVAQTTAAREPLQALTATEADLLDAIVARLIPSDANGPGATEAQAVRYIDRALAGALSGSREAYRVGLAAFDRYTRSSRRAPFTELSVTDQDSVLMDVESGSATGFPGSSGAFFNMVRSHTLQGTFGDPFYGGNSGFVGWDLLGYPGVRIAVTAEEQALGARLQPTHRSAYDHEMFTKASVRLQVPEGPSRGD
jgi:gluconate 2-dehydrogenase gamma chain